MSGAHTDGEAYDRAVGRWSRILGQEFVPWLGVRRDASWLDVGCGTGALTAAILDLAWPGRVTGVDTSQAFLEQARRNLPGADLRLGDAMALPSSAGAFDVTVSGLMLSHVSDPAGAAAEMVRVTRPGGTVGVYVWDADRYVTRHYWEAAAAAGAPRLDEDPRRRFPIASGRAVADLMRNTGLREVQTRALEAWVRFETFDEYWQGLLGRQGHTGSHLASLPAGLQDAVRRELEQRLGPGPFEIAARAWAARGRR